MTTLFNKRFRFQNKIFFFLVLLFFLFIPISLQSGAFQPGEKLEYKIQLGFFRVGVSTLSINPELSEISGVKCMVLKSTARTTGFADKMNHIEDQMISYYDPITKRSVSTAKRLIEGKHRREYHSEFEYNIKQASWWQKSFRGNEIEAINSKSGITSDIPENLLDALSAIYFTRDNEEKPEVGKEFFLDVYDDSILTKLQMTILREEEITVFVNGQKKKFSAIVVKPYLPTSGVFKSDGDIFIWISNDKRRIPLRITGKVKNFGEVSVELESMEGIVED
ncbi:MAG: DUF3108 domain-containing protein [Leptospiraceae bacterium]|nr:DUF3108 domain-containing protein [Leptospiraceae bacterium]